MKRFFGFSLVELLVVIAIIGILAALVLPALVAAKNQAKVTDNLSQLRQLGQAAALYNQDHGLYPRGTKPLVAGNYVPASLAASPLDETREGLSNRALKDTMTPAPLQNPTRRASYKNTYMGVMELFDNTESLERLTQKHGSVGWLLDFTSSERGRNYFPITWKGSYRRLNQDTSVVTRSISGVTCGGKYPQPCRPPHIFFFDPDEEDLRWIRDNL